MTTPPIETIRDALILPVGEGRKLPHGIYTPDGDFVETSRANLSMGRISDIATPEPDTKPARLKGRYLYAGIGRAHFGHFLIESLARLWALDHIEGPIDGVLFLPMPGHHFRPRLTGKYGPIYRALAGDLPTKMIKRPTRVEQLIVPPQGIGYLDLITGTAANRAFMANRFADHFPAEADSPDRIYVSRTGLNDPSKIHPQEPEIEAIMEAAGFGVFHPQKFSVDAQARIFRGARQVVGLDGSAFHYAGFCLNPDARVGIIKRRHRAGLGESLCHQIRAFSGAHCTLIDPLDPRKTLSSGDPLVHLGGMQRQLLAAGLL